MAHIPYRQRRSIYSVLNILGELQYVGGVLIDYVYHLSPESYFEKTKSVGEEWKLMPKRWVAFQFSKGRGVFGNPKVHISLDAYPTTLEGETSLEIKQGRFPTWSKITISSVSELKDILDVLKMVHKLSG